MPPGSGIVFATYLLQAALAVLLAAVLVVFLRRYRRDYLRDWAWSWLALAAYLTTGAASLALAPELSPIHPLRIGLSSASLACSYLQVGWLLVGAWEIARDKRANRRRINAWLVAAAVLGACSSLLFVGSDGGAALRFLVRVGVRSLLTGLGFAVAAWIVWHVSHHEARLGRRLLCAAFAAYGMQQGQYFVAAVLQLRGLQAFPRYSVYLGYVEALILAAVALGITIWLLEEEQLRVVAAGEEVQRLSFHDPLTGLANRRLLLDRLHQAIATARRNTERLGVVVLSLDRLPVVNDTHGFSAGDELLRAAAQRLQREIREGDTTARLGDHFAVVLAGLKAGREAAEILQRFLHALAEPYQIHAHQVVTTISAGFAIFPADADDGDTLLRRASSALAEARREGPGETRRWVEKTGSLQEQQLADESRLGHAIEAGELVLHYQPVVNLGTGEVDGLEALIRWQHPERGLLPPGQFMGLAESLGLSERFDLWALRTACQEVRQLHAEGLAGLRVAVNVSARTFQHPSLLVAITEALMASGMRADLLELEITETIAMRDIESTRRTLRALKGVGIRVAIDDFGTGYSSFAYLRTFTIDTVKIDRSFVLDLGRTAEAEAITAAMVALAHSLRLEVVAEGVETEEQRLALLRQQCDRMQGFLFARPVPADTCREFLLVHRSLPRTRLRVV